MTFFTSLIALRSGKPRCMRGMVPARGNPYITQFNSCYTGHLEVELTRGFSCRKHRNVENSLGFILTCLDQESGERLQPRARRRAAASLPRFRVGCRVEINFSRRFVVSTLCAQIEFSFAKDGEIKDFCAADC